MRQQSLFAAFALGLVATPTLQPKPVHVTVIGRDYQFELPDTLPAGPVTFRLENKGRMNHEVVIFAARPGVSAAQMMAATVPEERRALADPPVGVIFAPATRPQSAELLATLERGRWYIVFCGIRDTAGMPPHFMLGMVDSIFAR